MTGKDRRQGLATLACSLMRVLFVYALVLQALAPLSVARAEARGNVDGDHLVLCSATAGVDAARPVEGPARIAHDCLSCCLGGIVAALPVPVGLPEPAQFPLWLKPAAPEVLLRLMPAGGPPPQRAPPGLV